ncbi:uncharacterized protein LOC135694308 [Rhopilema esculentum]|uniref:uncharacterized protein LOC135694308 n=1 Tax=Rhopilema esculentum TaxID=499914 RepID=UPI0031D397FB|eukprot:gene4470-20714_t
MAGKFISKLRGLPKAAVEPSELDKRSLNPVLKAFLEGVHDDDCDLNRLKGMWHILCKIWGYITSFWKENIVITTKREAILPGDLLSFLDLCDPIDYRKHPFISSFESDICFPKPTGININMMPFVMNKKFEDCCLPSNLERYWSLFISRCLLDKEEKGKIGYLTIHESDVKANCSQRRPGLHTERPGKLKVRKSKDLVDEETDSGRGDSFVKEDQIYHNWGLGLWRKGHNAFEIKGGIFMASNVKDSCRIWDCQISDDRLIGKLGDIEYLREFLPNSEVMKENHLYWLTDRTPHESLCLKKGKYRQYFRLVTSQVSIWFEEHSTKNPLGVVPDPKITKIVGGSKFDEGSLYFVNDINKNNNESMDEN